MIPVSVQRFSSPAAQYSNDPGPAGAPCEGRARGTPWARAGEYNRRIEARARPVYDADDHNGTESASMRLPSADAGTLLSVPEFAVGQR